MSAILRTGRMNGRAERVGGGGEALLKFHDGDDREASLSPTIPATIRAMQISRMAVAGSRNKRIPSTAVPTVPIPVQTAYAVPSGRVRNASARSPTQPINATAGRPAARWAGYGTCLSVAGTHTGVTQP